MGTCCVSPSATRAVRYDGQASRQESNLRRAGNQRRSRQCVTVPDSRSDRGCAPAGAQRRAPTRRRMQGSPPSAEKTPALSTYDGKGGFCKPAPRQPTAGQQASGQSPGLRGTVARRRETHRRPPWAPPNRPIFAHYRLAAARQPDLRVPPLTGCSPRAYACAGTRGSCSSLSRGSLRMRPLRGPLQQGNTSRGAESRGLQYPVGGFHTHVRDSSGGPGPRPAPHPRRAGSGTLGTGSTWAHPALPIPATLPAWTLVHRGPM
jgi:hypothetical protein